MVGATVASAGMFAISPIAMRVPPGSDLAARKGSAAGPVQTAVPSRHRINVTGETEVGDVTAIEPSQEKASTVPAKWVIAEPSGPKIVALLGAGNAIDSATNCPS